MRHGLDLLELPAESAECRIRICRTAIPQLSSVCWHGLRQYYWHSYYWLWEIHMQVSGLAFLSPRSIWSGGGGKRLAFPKCCGLWSRQQTQNSECISFDTALSTPGCSPCEESSLIFRDWILVSDHRVQLVGGILWLVGLSHWHRRGVSRHMILHMIQGTCSRCTKSCLYDWPLVIWTFDFKIQMNIFLADHERSGHFTSHVSHVLKLFDVKSLLH